ncbi:MAG: hypothetical protein J3Q66DRAFT_446065 [Benniella sp.]|nr:MAG: hypothetical protein J3Q66DRAFT_446065 [Benniella sp.]
MVIHTVSDSDHHNENESYSPESFSSTLPNRPKVHVLMKAPSGLVFQGMLPKQMVDLQEDYPLDDIEAVLGPNPGREPICSEETSFTSDKTVEEERTLSLAHGFAGTGTTFFTSVVRRTIDCNAPNRTFELDPTAIKKHGHRIRVIRGVWGIHDLKVLQGSSLCMLQSLSMIIDGTPSIQADSFDFLRQNVASLRSVEISVSVEEMWSTKVFFPIGATSTCYPGNHAALKLTHLKIESSLHPRGFSSFLRICPPLKVLDIMETNLYSDLSLSEPYHHTGLVQLHTSPQQMLRPDSDSPNALLPGPLSKTTKAQDMEPIRPFAAVPWDD